MKRNARLNDLIKDLQMYGLKLNKYDYFLSTLSGWKFTLFNLTPKCLESHIFASLAPCYCKSKGAGL